MKPFLFLALFLLPLAANSQIYVPLKVVNNVATFETIAEVENASATDIHERSIEWINKTFLSEPVITQNTDERISVRFFQEYSKDGWSDNFQHNLQIDIQDQKAVFKITDTGLGLVRDGDFKEHLAKMKVMFEQAANDLFWSYTGAVKQTDGNE